MRKFLLRRCALGIYYLLICFGASPAFAYDYPYQDPYVATVLGTPTALRMPVVAPEHVSVYRITPFEHSDVLPVFWQGRALRFELAKHKRAAPLMFILGGTGNTFQAASVQSLRNLFYSAGFHVLSLSSPTTPEFIAAASSSMRPGIAAEDAQDIYAAMMQALSRVRRDIKLGDRGIYLTGYSIGGMQAAFISALDEQVQAFNFRKVLLINPPVNLYDSASRLDALVSDKLPGGIAQAGPFLEEILGRYAAYFQRRGGAEVDSEFLYALQKDEPLSDNQLAALIGLVFRLAGANMTFSADALAHTGEIVPAHDQLAGGDTMTGYFKRSLHWTFRDYFDRLLLPYWRTEYPNATVDSLIRKMSLHEIADYLKRQPKIGVIANRDDIILGGEDLDFLARTLGSRCTIYPHGGHGGNLDYHENQTQMLKFFDAHAKKAQ